MALLFDFVLAIAINLHTTYNYTEEIYGNPRDKFVCENFHGDAFYCPASRFFTTHALKYLYL